MKLASYAACCLFRPPTALWSQAALMCFQSSPRNGCADQRRSDTPCLPQHLVGLGGKQVGDSGFVSKAFGHFTSWEPWLEYVRWQFRLCPNVLPVQAEMISCVSRSAQADFCYKWLEQSVCIKCLAVSIGLEMLDLMTDSLAVKSNGSESLPVEFRLAPSPARLSRKASEAWQADSSDPPLRPCQRECLEACAKGARVIEMACGTGKTRVMKELARNISGRVPWSVPALLIGACWDG